MTASSSQRAVRTDFCLPGQPQGHNNASPWPCIPTKKTNFYCCRSAPKSNSKVAIALVTLPRSWSLPSRSVRGDRSQGPRPNGLTQCFMMLLRMRLSPLPSYTSLTRTLTLPEHNPSLTQASPLPKSIPKRGALHIVRKGQSSKGPPSKQTLLQHKIPESLVP